MNISVLFEGGLGDHLAANRFMPAILEAYPHSEISLFSNTEGNKRSAATLMKYFPHFYEGGVEVIPERNKKEFLIRSQLGQENWTAAYENIPTDYRGTMESHDKFFNFHIDGMQWIHYGDIPWQKYFYQFPRPAAGSVQTLEESKFSQLERTDYVLCHLFSRPNSDHNLEQWYVIQLIKKISQKVKVVVVTEGEHRDYYSELFDNPQTLVTTPGMDEIFSLSEGCAAFIGIDSGIRYIPLHFQKPTFVFSKFKKEGGMPPLSHLMRWLIYPQFVLPMHHDIDLCVQTIHNSVGNPIGFLFPQIDKTRVDEAVIKRNYVQV